MASGSLATPNQAQLEVISNFQLQLNAVQLMRDFMDVQITNVPDFATASFTELKDMYFDHMIKKSCCSAVTGFACDSSADQVGLEDHLALFSSIVWWCEETDGE